jgi:hypothetical protein
VNVYLQITAITFKIEELAPTTLLLNIFREDLALERSQGTLFLLTPGLDLQHSYSPETQILGLTDPLKILKPPQHITSQLR